MQVMLDIETLDTRPGGTITAIGAVKFNNRGCYSEFYVRPHWQGGLGHDTVRFWLGQPEAARSAILEPPTDFLRPLLVEFLSFAGDCPIWGNGAAFDNAHLAWWCREFGLEWPFRQDRCYRTLRNLFPEVEFVPPEIKHHALHDAKAQALHLIHICNSAGIEL